MVDSPFAFRAALPTICVVACTAGAPAPGGSTPEPASAPGGAATAPDTAAPPPRTAEPAQPHARWTVFVYANGDSGRSRDLAADLAHISAAKLSPDTKIIVLADWNAALSDVDGKLFPGGSEWISISGSGARTVFAREAERDFDDPSVLRDAVARVFHDHPADHHGLVVWSRSDAADVQDGRRPGAKPMSVPAMTSAIRDGLGASGLRGDRALDFIGFDSFAPARIEVVYGMRALAQVQVLNTAKPSGSTWAYADAFTFLAEQADASASSFAAFEATAAAEHGTRVHAAIATTGLDGLAAATSSFVQAVIANPAALPGVVSAMQATVAHAKDANRAPSYRRFVDELASRHDLGAVSPAAEAVAVQLAQVFVDPEDETSDLGISLPTDGLGTSSGAIDHEASKDWWAATDWEALIGSWQTP